MFEIDNDIDWEDTEWDDELDCLLDDEEDDDGFFLTYEDLY